MQQGEFLCFFQFSEYQEEGSHLEQEGNGPGDRIGNIQTLRGMELRNLENGVDPADADAADTEHGQHHGNEGFAKAAQCAGGHIHQTTDPVSQTDEAESQHAVTDGFLGVCDIQRQQGRTEPVGQGAQNQSGDGNADQADGQRSGNTLILPGTGVLTDKVHGGLMEGVQRGVDETFDIACGGIAGHEHTQAGDGSVAGSKWS